MTEEPYRWLEAIGNRREYIQEQLKGGTPVFALSRPEGILLLGVGQGQSKVFEIFDRHALAALGHPVDIERIRQAAIEAAHMEGFNRSAKDVTLRRLIGFALSTTLKNSFEQIFSPPFIVESIFAELGESAGEDVLVRVRYDGNHQYETSGLSIAANDPKREDEATAWLRARVKPEQSLTEVASLCLALWQAMVDNQSIDDLPLPESPVRSIPGRKIEAALLDRSRDKALRYRPFELGAADGNKG